MRRLIHYLCSEVQTLTNLIKSYIGSGVLALPFAFRQGGLLASITTIVVLAGQFRMKVMHLSMLILILR
jgi:amino acid permease